jgi:hypothetical protein
VFKWVGGVPLCFAEKVLDVIEKKWPEGKRDCKNVQILTNVIDGADFEGSGGKSAGRGYPRGRDFGCFTGDSERVRRIASRFMAYFTKEIPLGLLY